MTSANISDNEGILVVSCDQSPPEDIILRILGLETLPETEYYCDIDGYPWHLDTKYYSAKVYLYALKRKEALQTDFSDAIRAVVFYLDSSKSSCFDEVKSWIPYLKCIDAEVQLLICNNSVDESTEGDRKNILNWCVQNQYELIELNSTSESDDEEECSIKDVKGYERVIQSLQSHPWANLVMKDEKCKFLENEDNSVEESSASSQTSAAISSNNSVELSKENEVNKSNTETKKDNPGNGDLDLEEQLLSNVLNGEDPGGESFEALFTKFASMKDKAANLNGEDRKKYAEEVAIAFWRAMGGEEDEIEGLDDDE